ncbi:cysteine desulfurase NifS [Myxococcota bacterium]|nr:cysteine desulfurase NifS [Myxococcota bacterium]MBU1381922.1 cysteine desulfurase NifS [Myxococcota bacterium]MBU1497823.1 cysteine desulfurase NifS [Myxococcota bacterium]
MENQIYYFDNNATTRVAPEVLETMLPYFSELYGNSSSMHDFGGSLGDVVDKARSQVANLLGAEDPSEIIFTSCGTESDNAAINSAVLSQPGKKHIITSKVEHPAIINYYEYLEKNGYDITWLDVDGDGLLSPESVINKVRSDTALVSLMWANNETGVIFPVEEIAAELKKKNVIFHTDAVQAAGKIPIDLKNNQITMLSISGHKLHAPKGIGALYVRRGTMFKPFIIGGHQERGRRAGTTPVAMIAGLGKACDLAEMNMDEENVRVKYLRDLLENLISESVPAIEFIGHRDQRLPNTANISFGYIEGEAILLMLSEMGIAASSGSACSSGSLEPSHVLRAMGKPFETCHASIRFSLSIYNTEEEVRHVASVIPDIIRTLRRISPFTPRELIS